MSRAMVPAVAVLLTACVEDATAPDRSGSMSFTYHGALGASPSGSFSVQGGRNSYPSGAGGQNLGGGIMIVGSRDRGTQQLSVTVLGAMALGALPMCDNGPTPSNPCVDGGYFASSQHSGYSFGWGPPLPVPEMRVTITDLTASRVRGTFEGVAVGYCGECGSYVVDTATISGGVFDVPYR